ncbi:MAG: hypothetical protein GC152_06495 [Alphaproteobacteria bacterium]|nr:hypothetical protein [Alphaproteobacteria bacterium]
MKRILSASIASIAVLGDVAMANDTMDAMVDAKVTYTYADGSVVTADYNPDGTYTTDIAGGGKWRMTGDELCIETDNGDEGCTTIDGGKVKGDSWEAVDAFGNPVTIAIV